MGAPPQPPAPPPHDAAAHAAQARHAEQVALQAAASPSQFQITGEEGSPPAHGVEEAARTPVPDEALVRQGRTCLLGHDRDVRPGRLVKMLREG
ncbi:MAG: hypothetical protein ACKOBY_03085, partial [Cyanobium sp.]